MKKILLPAIIAIFLTACGNSGSNDQNQSSPANADSGASKGSGTDKPATDAYDPKRGEGKFTKVDVSPTLNAAMAETGNKIFTVKCAACHKLTDEKLVGPGWKGVTGRHSAEWIMNFATNPDVMLDKDPKAQAMLEICLVRMPNQNLADDEARAIYEFMRKNDGVK